MDDSIKIFSGQANVPFCDNICQTLGVLKSSIEYIRFNDGELSVKILESVRGKDVFLIQSLSAPVNDHLMEMLITIDALKRASAKRISVIIPYFAYARQDRLGDGRQPISAKLLANLISSAGANRVLTIEPHTPQLMAFFDIPVDNLYGTIVFLDYVKNKNLKNPIVASPDVGGVARARSLAKSLNLDMVIVDKRREKANESEVMNIIGDVNGKDVILIDDMIDTAGTIVKAAEVLKKNGATSVMAFCTHPVLSGPAYDRINSGVLDELVTTDTIPLKEQSPYIKVLTTAPLFGEVIRRVYHDESVNSLFY